MARINQKASFTCLGIWSCSISFIFFFSKFVFRYLVQIRIFSFCIFYVQVSIGFLLASYVLISYYCWICFDNGLLILVPNRANYSSRGGGRRRRYEGEDYGPRVKRLRGPPNFRGRTEKSGKTGTLFFPHNCMWSLVNQNLLTLNIEKKSPYFLCCYFCHVLLLLAPWHLFFPHILVLVRHMLLCMVGYIRFTLGQARVSKSIIIRRIAQITNLTGNILLRLYL